MTDRRALNITTLLIAWIASGGAVAAFAKDKPALQAVQMPYVFHDDRGSEWDIQPDGTIGDGGNDLFDTGARLTIGEAQFAPGAAPQMDPVTNELVFSPNAMGGLSVSRRVGCNPKLAYIRYTEIFDNPSATPVKTTVHLSFNLGGGIQFTQPLMGGKQGKQSLGMVVGNDGNCMAHIGAGGGSKLLPSYSHQPDNSELDVTWDIEVPAKQQIAITHLVCRRSNLAEGSKVLEEVSDKSIVKELPPDIAKRLANFPHSGLALDDQDILRGDLFDIIELRGGDQYKGTIKQEKYRLVTFYGAVELPADKVISEMTSGEFRPRQLLVTRDGEIFGGHLETDTIKLELTNGQVTSVPLAQIARMGYRKRADEPEELKFDKPFVLLRGGDRIVVQPPANPITVATRYGTVSIKPAAIAAILFSSEEHAVHEVQLTDGSKFVGIVTGDAFEMKLATTGQTVSFPATSLRRIQLAPHPDDLDADAPAVNLTTGDQLIGKLAGSQKLQTAFDTLTLNGEEIRTIQPAKGTGNDVQVTMWDGATLSGQLDSEQLEVALTSGVSMKVPVGLVETYNNPQPRPSTQVVDRIKAILVDLNAEDWKARDRAESQLIAIGPAVAGVLGELRANQPSESQQRIDLIIKTVKAAKASVPEVHEEN